MNNLLKMKRLKLATRIAAEKTETIKESIALMMHRFDDAATVVFVALLDELEKRLPENEYVQFCNELK